uniref:Uncharacterized protein n=1 Tax=Chlamydiamicrovirus sp. TaxID=2832664 RepID=A0AB39A398_9VIRU
MKRRPMNNKESKKKFQNGAARVKKENIRLDKPMRGGYRL